MSESLVKAHSDSFIYAENLPAPEKCHSFLQPTDAGFSLPLHNPHGTACGQCWRKEIGEKGYQKIVKCDEIRV